MPTSYPTAADLNAVLTAAGITTDTTQRLHAVAAAISEWGRLTRYPDFLAETSSSTAYYDSDGTPYLSLKGYISISAVTTGITWSESGGVVSEVAGTSRYEKVDYLARREKADEDSPLTWLEWLSVPCAGTQSVKIVGVKGAYSNLPDEAWSAILDGAIVRMYRLVAQKNSGGASEIAIGNGDLKVKFGDWKNVPLMECAANFKTASKAYRRKGL